MSLYIFAYGSASPAMPAPITTTTIADYIVSLQVLLTWASKLNCSNTFVLLIIIAVDRNYGREEGNYILINTDCKMLLLAFVSHNHYTSIIFF